MQHSNINDNPLSARWKKRLSEQSPEVQSKIKELDVMNPKDYQLKVIKRSKLEPKEGDVFLVSPREGMYFYGRVLKANIKHLTKDAFIHGKSVVVIFKRKTRNPDISEFSEQNDELLIEPIIVDSSYWSKGFFFTVGNIPINTNKNDLDYGFYSIGKGKYLEENGNELFYQPKILGTYGIATITTIARMIEKELIINPNLLIF